MSNTTDLRGALEAAISDLTAARALLAALTPPMDEPKWPGAPVIAACNGGRERLHTHRNDGPGSGWECSYRCTSTMWDRLLNPRPLTPAEYAEYGIPEPCTHAADEETTQRAEGATP